MVYENFKKNNLTNNDKSYIIKLEKFEGPLDLLLYLIKKAEIDIYDIPIHEITAQYLKYIQLMKKLDVNVSAEFIIMAANLIYIKSRTLLPIVSDIEEEYFENPRTELVNQLLEYQKFKEISKKLESLDETHTGVFTKAPHQITFDFEDADNWVDVSLFDLINIFNKLISETKQEQFNFIEPEPVTVSMKIEEIKLKFEVQNEFGFDEIFSDNITVVEIIVAFLAILELVKQKIILVKQHSMFGDIKIFKRSCHSRESGNL